MMYHNPGHIHIINKSQEQIPPQEEERSIMQVELVNNKDTKKTYVYLKHLVEYLEDKSMSIIQDEIDMKIKSYTKDKILNIIEELKLLDEFK